jgi:hypothetical protein
MPWTSNGVSNVTCGSRCFASPQRLHPPYEGFQGGSCIRWPPNNDFLTGNIVSVEHLMDAKTLGLRKDRIVADPDSAHRDIPEPGLGLVVRDIVVVEQRTHVVGLVVGHTAEIEQELGHGPMIVTAAPRGGLKPEVSPLLIIWNHQVRVIPRTAVIPSRRRGTRFELLRTQPSATADGRLPALLSVSLAVASELLFFACAKKE